MNHDHQTPLRYLGSKATVLGLGTFGGGVAAVQYLASQGAEVIVTDLRSQETLQDSIDACAGVQLKGIYLGGHPPEAFCDCDLLVVSPAVGPDHPVILECQHRGVRITSELGLFLEHNRGRVVAVTGSNGKSTTAALAAHLLRTVGQRHGFQVYLGGNIGISLLPVVDQITEQDVVVLEVSSFQLEQLQGTRFAPDVAILTNFSANHLDRHGTLDAYRRAKQIVFDRQLRHHTAITPADADPSWRVRGQHLYFGLTDGGEDGAFFDAGHLVLRDRIREDSVRLSTPRSLPGRHNALNIAAAACAAWKLGADPEFFVDDLRTFQALPHRLQLVAEGRGLRFYDDSVSTTPESTIAALHTFPCPVVILVGGADKGSDLTELCETLICKADTVVCIGATGPAIADTLASGLSPESRLQRVVVADHFEEAFSQAVELAPSGGIVLLSPGFASYGWFRDYRDRGQQFRRLSNEWVSQ